MKKISLLLCILLSTPILADINSKNFRVIAESCRNIFNGNMTQPPYINFIDDLDAINEPQTKNIAFSLIHLTLVMRYAILKNLNSESSILKAISHYLPYTHYMISNSFRSQKKTGPAVRCSSVQSSIPRKMSAHEQSVFIERAYQDVFLMQQTRIENSMMKIIISNDFHRLKNKYKGKIEHILNIRSFNSICEAVFSPPA